MDVDIILRGTLDNTASDDLRELQGYTDDADIASQQVTIDAPHVKEPITIGLAIASLAVSSISALISAVSLWNSQHPKYAVTVHAGDNSYQISNLGKADLAAIVERLRKLPEGQAVIMRITRK